MNRDSGCVFYYFRQLLTVLRDRDRTIIPLRVLASAEQEADGWLRYTTRLGLGVTFKYHELRKFVSKKCHFIFVKREMPSLFPVNCDRTNLFSVKRELDPPPPTSLPLYQSPINTRTIPSVNSQFWNQGAERKFKNWIVFEEEFGTFFKFQSWRPRTAMNSSFCIYSHADEKAMSLPSFLENRDITIFLHAREFFLTLFHRIASRVAYISFLVKPTKGRSEQTDSAGRVLFIFHSAVPFCDFCALALHFLQL